MSLASVSRGHAFVATALCVALVSHAASAQTDSPATTPASPPAAKAATGPLKVSIEAHGLAFDRAKLRASLSRELGREVVLVDAVKGSDVQIELDSATRADVHYTTPSGELLRRSVELPPDGERAVQVVSWLTVNLVRDEASELLDELRARRKEEADARAAAEQAAADQAATEKAAADKVAADRAAAEAEKKKAESAKAAENAAGGPPKNGENAALLRDPLRSYDAAFATPISVVRDSKKRLLHLQLAFVFGESGGLEGAAVAPGVLRIRHDLLGVASGAAAVVVGGSARGAVMAVGFSDVGGNLEGVQLGAGVAIQHGPVARGAIVAVGGAFAGNVDGAVLGGGIASAKSLNGAGLAAGINVIRGPSQGVLIAGGVNFSADHRGVELAGGVNAARDLDGVALAPINVHRRVKGVQFGVVNVAEEVDGVAIGVLSFAKNGRVQPVLWTAIDGSAHVAVKSIAGWAFTQLGAGINLGEDSFSYDGGVGLHVRLGDHVFLEPGVHYSSSNKTADAAGDADEHQLHYLLQAGYRVGDKLDFLVAAGVRHTIVGGSGAAVGPDLRGGIAFF